MKIELLELLQNAKVKAMFELPGLVHLKVVHDNMDYHFNVSTTRSVCADVLALEYSFSPENTYREIADQIETLINSLYVTRFCLIVKRPEFSLMDFFDDA